MAANKAIRRLLARIEDLKSEVDALNSQVEETEATTHRQIENARYQSYIASQDARRERQHLKDEIQSKTWERQRLVRELERARDWRDSWGVERAMRKLKYL